MELEPVKLNRRAAVTALTPRSTEPTALTNRYLRSICQRLNATPRKCLGYRTPAEVFEAKLVDIQNRLT